MLVKLAGVAYLIWLGIQTIWHSQRHSSNEASVPLPQRARRPWLTGFTNNLLTRRLRSSIRVCCRSSCLVVPRTLSRYLDL
jgi:hypothetical protein